ncbi:MAG: YwaF family protein [Christensenellaceae bacterium]|jgi:hypothetical protein|nr:YwaF family protein [Christensenellaceae bacterium]
MKNKVICAIIGVFFAFSFLAFALFHSPWKAFGFLHIYGLLMSLALPFAIAYLCSKDISLAKRIALILSIILALSPLTRPFFLPLVRENMSEIKSWDMAIPFNLCNISAILYLIAVLTDNQVIKNYMITFGLFGGLINNVQAHNTDRGTFWFYLTWESYFVHVLIIVIPIFMLLTNQIKPNIKKAMWNVTWILPFFLLAGFLINPAWKTNFHFTVPNSFTKAVIPTMTEPWIIFGQPVDPIFMIGVLIMTAIACTLLYILSWFIYKRCRPKFSQIPSSPNK